SDRWLASTTRPHARELLQPDLQEPLPPTSHRCRGDMHLLGDPGTGKPVRGHQQHASALDITMRRGVRAQQLFQHPSLLVVDSKRGCRKAHTSSYLKHPSITRHTTSVQTRPGLSGRQLEPPSI